MNIIDQIIAILTPIVPVLIVLLHNRLEGLRTKLITYLGMITGAWAIVSESLLPKLCDTYHIFCNITDNKFYGTALAIASFVAYVIRELQGSTAKIKDLPQRLKAGWQVEVQKLRAR